MSAVRRKFALIAGLYMAQAVPVGFLVVAMPVILRRSGQSLEMVGLFSAIALPWVVKFLWAPWLDRWGSPRAHFSSWIVVLQALAVTTVVALSGFDIDRDLPLIVGLSVVFMLLAATQDIATDGLSVRVLGSDERGPGNAIQVGGYYLGQVLGSGGVLALYALFGWTPALLAMAVVLLLPLLAMPGFREPRVEGDRARVGYRAMGHFVRRAGFGWVACVVLFRAGEAMATYVYNQMLVDRVDLVDIGLISGGLYALGALGGATCGGLFIGRLGRRRALVVFGAVQAMAVGLYVLPALGIGGTVLLYGAPAVVGAAGGLATSALYTAMMDHSEAITAATDFTLQQSLAAIGPLVGTILSGFVAAAVGFAAHFAFCAVLGGLGALAAARARLAPSG